MVAVRAEERVRSDGKEVVLSPEQKTRALVTGADGFIGSRLVHRLLQDGMAVTALCHHGLTAGRSRLLAWGVADRVDVRVCDVCDCRSVEETMQEANPRLVFHLAAQTIVTRGQEEARSTIDANVRGTYNVVDSARRLPELKAIVVASSDKAYGSSDVLPYVETMPLLGGAIYDSSKAAADILVRSLARTLGLPMGVTRCANVYGPGDLHMTRIVPDSCVRIARNEPPLIRGHGRHKRDFLFLDDAVEGYVLLAEAIAVGAVEPGAAFNFGTGEPTEILTLVEEILDLAGRRDLQPVILAKDTPFEIDEQYLDTGKALKALEWRPKTPLSIGLQRTLDWYRSRQEVDDG
ncbi:NAD-dependent epimerase/dehydratase family protein [Gemmatimonadota bacterium]